MESNNSIVSGFDNDKDDSLKITLHKIPGVENSCMVVLEGYIDTYNSSFFQKQLTKVIGAGFLIYCLIVVPFPMYLQQA